MKQVALNTSKKIFLPLHRENSFHRRRFLGSAINLWLMFLFVSPPLFPQASFSVKSDPVVPNGLAAYYPFSGNANDESDNGRNGIIHGATLAKDRFNTDLSAMSFHGANNIIDIGDILDEIFCEPVASFTVSAWAKANAVYGPLPIVCKSAGGSGPYQWTVGINMFGSSGFATGEIYSDTVASNYKQLRRPVIAGQWYHFVLVFDGDLPENNRVKFYVNGQTDSVFTHIKVGTIGTTTVNSQQYITIGGTHEPGNTGTVASPYSGVIDDVRIYDRPLTIAQIDSLYHVGGWNHPPVANAGSDRTVIADSSGSAEVTLNGSDSSDPDSDSLTYLWREGTDTLGFGPAEQIIVTLPAGIHTVMLTVDDGNGGTSADSVVITVVDFPNDLAVYYPFNGNANDSSGNGFHGTVYAATSTADRFGIAGKAYNFNGSNNYIDLGYQPALSLTEGTIITWIKTSSAHLNQAVVLAQGQGKPQLVIVSGKARVQWGATDKSFPGLLSSTRIDDTAWHCVAGLWSPSGFKIYIDGMLEGSLTTQLTQLNSNCQIQIGGFNLPVCGGAVNPYIGQFLSGKVDDIRIFSRQLNIAEIDSFYHEGGWNKPPIADAGPDRTIVADSSGTAEVTLNGSGSSDPDGDSLIYLWREGPDTLGFVSAPQITVTLPLGVHAVTLTVNDGKEGSDTDVVVITIVDFSNNLAAYYPLNGNANDESGNGYNGTVHGATPTKDRFSNDSSAMSFNGFNNWISCGDILDGVFSDSVAKFTVTGWAKINSFGSGSDIIGKAAGGSGPYEWSITYTSTGDLIGAVFSDTMVNNYISFKNPVTTNRWFQVALVFDGSLTELERVKLYVDGSTVHSTIYHDVGTLGTGTKNSQQNLLIGANHFPNSPSSPSHFVNGAIDDIRIYSRALSAAEIDSLYHEGGWAVQSNPLPIAHYPFNKNANDESGHGSDGIVHGAILTTDRFGKSDSAYHFTGGAYIRIPELFPDSCQAFTFAAWVKKDAVDNGRHVIIYKGTQKGEASLIITPGVLGFGVNLYVPGTPTNTQNWYAANVTDTLKANTNYFIVGRYIKGVKVDLWINGTEVSSSTIPNLNLLSDPFGTYSAVGNHTEPTHSITDWWKGVIDDIRVYNRSLSALEIDSLYHEGGWPLQPPTSVPLSRLGTEIPESFQLYDNYPNPFNPGTNIKFAIPQEEFVTLKVYDMLGKEVAILVSEYLTPGIYTVRYTVRGISSSIYFYRLKAGTTVQTKRMMLLK